MAALQSILVPVDGSPPSLAALAHAVVLAEDNDAHLDVLHVEAPDTFNFGSSSPLAPDARREITRALEAAVAQASSRLGARLSRKTNVRSAAAAARGDRRETMRLTFRAGSVIGSSVAGFSTLVLLGCYVLLRDDMLAMVGVLVGVSLISLFASVCGGIYTKGADVGADLVGKVETRIPEDDPRNPAVIADNVGDNVGDCAGMTADLFESYLVTGVAAMLLGHLIGDIRAVFPHAVVYPLAVCGWGIVATLVGAAFVRMRRHGTITGALYRGLAATIVVAGGGLYVLDVWLMNGSSGLLVASLAGLAVVVVLVALTNHYTSARSRPVCRIASAASAGAGQAVITGLSVGLTSVWFAGFVIAAGILVAFFATGWTGDHLEPMLGLYGIGIAAISMLSVMGMIVAIAAFGPIADNAGGIVEMAALPEAARNVTDALDAAGNTTKAVTKGYAIGSAAVAALSLLPAYTIAAAGQLGVSWSELTYALTIDNPIVLVGMLIGGLLPFFFTSFLMNAVSVAAQAVVAEVRRQFDEIPGLVQGTARPEYGRCVSIVTSTALRQLFVPGVLSIGVPLAVGFLLGPVAVAGLLLGVIIAGLPLALVMTTSGAAWDNAKKYIERGHLGSKSSAADASAIVGDTVGDAMKDAAGPAINPLVKVVNTVSLLCVGLVASYGLAIPSPVTAEARAVREIAAPPAFPCDRVASWPDALCARVEPPR
jgi:K(+)-stimulated pyrophosphate-energized sodium pump